MIFIQLNQSTNKVSIIQVTLELMMWTIFALVSILTAATLLLDDWYKRQEKEKMNNNKKIRDSQADIIFEGQDC